MAPDTESEPVPPAGEGEDDEVTESVSEIEDLSQTGMAPSFHVVRDAPPPPAPVGPAAIEFPAPGETVDDFRLLEVLGEGAFGKVYLAEQLSLGRRVALKITADRGEEARTMASVDHESIVRVFSETRDEENGTRLICMQYIPGPTLAGVIGHLRRYDPSRWGGELFLQAIDILSRGSTTLDPVALRDRELLRRLDFSGVVAWIGARLAEALHFAHTRGVLHRDLKPANIILDQYGRPYLADFSLSLQTGRVEAGSDSLFGGTLAYMAPEHLEAFSPYHEGDPDRVDERSDLYGLVLVLHELWTGRRAFEPRRDEGDHRKRLETLIEERRRGLPSADPDQPHRAPELERTFLRGTATDPRERHESALELAHSLEGARAMRRAREDSPPAGWITRQVRHHPRIGLVLLAVLPHLLGSAVNISYNALRITGGLAEAQRQVFVHLVLVYNALVYPVCLGLLALLIHRILALGQTLDERDGFVTNRARSARRQVLLLPRRAAAIACLGWFPGALFFPLGLDWLAGPVETEVYVHFLISFAVSGLIALTYSFLGLTCASLGALYPGLWPEPAEFSEAAPVELAGQESWLRRFRALAGAIPLVGALVLIGVGTGGEDGLADRQFRILTASLIVLGGIGYQFADRLVTRLTSWLTVWTRGRGAASGS